MPATIFFGEKIKALKAALQLEENATIQSGSLDPTITPVNMNAGDIYISTSTFKTYQKQDSGLSTNFNTVLTGTSLTANRALQTDGSGNVQASATVSTTELGYLDGVTSAIQTQLDAKVDEVASTDNAVTRFDGTGGSIQNSGVTLSDANVLTVPGRINADGGIDLSASGTLSIGTTPNATIINIGNSGATVNIQGSTIFEETTTLEVEDPLITLNKGGGVGSAQDSGIQLEENAVFTGYAKTSLDRNSWRLKAPNTAGDATITPGAGGITLNQSSHDPVTLGTANGLSLSTQQLSLGLSSTSTTGALSSTDWNTFNGAASATTAATSVNTPNTIVKRDGSGNFSAGTITANLTGSASGNLAKSTGDLDQGSFTGANNQSSPANVTGLAFANGSVRSFDALVSVSVDATSDLFEQFKIEGVQRGADWQLSMESTGDASGVAFDITNAGQLQYTSGNYSGFSSLTIKYRALSTAV